MEKFSVGKEPIVAILSSLSPGGTRVIHFVEKTKRVSFNENKECILLHENSKGTEFTKTISLKENLIII